MRILIQACRIIYLFIKRELDFNRRITWLLSIFANSNFAFFKLNNYYKIINNAKQDENTSFRNTTRTDGFQTSFLTFLVNGGIHCIQRFGRVIKSKRADDSYKNSTTVWSSKVTFRTVWRRFPYRFALKCRIGFGSPASKHVQFLDSERTQNVSKPESQMITEKWSRNNRRSKQCQTWISERVKRKFPPQQRDGMWQRRRRLFGLSRGIYPVRQVYRGDARVCCRRLYASHAVVHILSTVQRLSLL